MSESEDIRDVRSEEQRRGKRPANIAALRRRRILLEKFKEALQNNDEEQFKEAIINVLGQLPGTPEYAQSIQAWRELHGRS